MDFGFIVQKFGENNLKQDLRSQGAVFPNKTD